MRGNVTSDATREKVRAAWTEGLSMSAIGERLCMTKNQISGLVHRMGLTGRPSPIKLREPKPAAPRKPRSHGANPKPPQLASLASDAAPVMAPQPKPMPITHRCLWPMWGHRQRPTQQFCGAPVASRVYCAEHARVAYTGAGEDGMITQEMKESGACFIEEHRETLSSQFLAAEVYTIMERERVDGLCRKVQKNIDRDFGMTGITHVLRQLWIGWEISLRIPDEHTLRTIVGQAQRTSKKKFTVRKTDGGIVVTRVA